MCSSKSTAEIFGYTPNSCGKYPSTLRTSFFSASTSIPSRSIDPASGSCSVAMVRMSELFPAPFGPSSPNITFPIESETLLSALTPFEYVLDNPRIVNATVSLHQTQRTHTRQILFNLCMDSVKPELRTKARGARTHACRVPTHGDTMLN